MNRMICRIICTIIYSFIKNNALHLLEHKYTLYILFTIYIIHIHRYEVKPGEVLERYQSHLEQFEVFRMKWKEEARRKSLLEETKLLEECFDLADL